MLSQKYRLTRSADFTRVRVKGRSWPDRLVVLAAVPNGLDVSRFGFSVSKRIGNAVVRNRTRRLLREAVRLQMDVISPGWDVVFVARRSIAGRDFEAVEGSVVRLLVHAGLYRESGRESGQEGEPA